MKKSNSPKDQKEVKKMAPTPMTPKMVLNDIKRVMLRTQTDPTTPTDKLRQVDYLRKNGAVSHVTIMKMFGNFDNAVKMVQNDPTVTGQAAELLIARDIRRVARELGRVPTRDEYIHMGKFGKNVVTKNYGSWTQAVKTVL